MRDTTYNCTNLSLEIQDNDNVIFSSYHEHTVEEDVPICNTVLEKKCEDVTQGYTTEQKCTEWPQTKCTLERKTAKKHTPETECKKVPFELCGPSGCPVEPGQEQCQDRRETVRQNNFFSKTFF